MKYGNEKTVKWALISLNLYNYNAVKIFTRNGNSIVQLGYGSPSYCMTYFGHLFIDSSFISDNELCIITK